MEKTCAITVRLPPELAERIRRLAREDYRSLNSTIVRLLALALQEIPEPSPEARSPLDSESGDSSGPGALSFPQAPGAHGW